MINTQIYLHDCFYSSSKIDIHVEPVFEKGVKGPNDYKCSFKCHNCDAFHNFKFAELAVIIVELCKNEDRLYPAPAKGGMYLLDFFKEVFYYNRLLEEPATIPERLTKKYKLDKNEK